MPHREIDRMVSPEAASRDGNLRRRVPRANERDHFMDQVRVVLHVPRGPLRGMDALVVPAFLIHGIDAEGLQFTRLVLVARRFDYLAIFIIEEAPFGRGKY